MDSLDFTIPGIDTHKRKAFRTSVPGLAVYLPDHGTAYRVLDLSASGMGVADKDSNPLKLGEVFTFDIVLNNKPLVSKLTAEVMRKLDSGLVGCTFINLDPKLEAKIDKFVLEVQKRLIALKRAKSEQNNQ